MRRFFFIQLTLAATATSSLMQATTLPQSYPLVETRHDLASIDPKLGAWLATHDPKTPPLEDSAKAFEASIKNEPRLTKRFLELRRAALLEKRSNASLDTVIEEARAVARRGGALRADEALWPYLVDEILRQPGLEPELRRELRRAVLESPDRGCPRKRFLLSDIVKLRAEPTDLEGLRTVLKQVTSFHSERFRQKALRNLIVSLPEDQRAAVQPDLWPYVEDWPRIVGENPWLRPEASPKTEDATRTRTRVDTLAAEVEAAVKAGQCDSGKTGLLKALGELKGDPKSLDKTMDVVEKIARCIPRKTGEERIQFLEETTDSMKNAYGFPGWAEMMLRIASRQWSAQRIDKARDMYLEIQKNAKLNNHPSAQARALFALARIEEKEGNVEAAATYYRTYIDQIANTGEIDAEELERVLMGAVMLDVARANFPAVLEASRKIIDDETAKPLDDRAHSLLSFALFWKGRAHLALGQKEAAEEHWKRLASEAFSTFYGALGHYLLERSTGKRFFAEPLRSPMFDVDGLTRAFDRDEDQTIVRRAQVLLRQGLKEDAVCEINELDVADGEHTKLALKALLLTSAGDYLASVKIFDRLPRSFRAALPGGFERVLFPSAHLDLVRTYASRVKLDPDFALAIIRQESVFQANVKSPAGAIGLTQLMPATARREIRFLAPGYITAESKLARGGSTEKRTGKVERDPAESDPEDTGAQPDAAAASTADSGSTPSAPGADTDTAESSESQPAAVSEAPSKPVSVIVPTDRMLYDDEVNLAIGIHHMHRLLKDWGNPILVLTSYNAGPNATRRWTTEIPQDQPLVFIERIPYRETRGYVKLILRNYFYYKRFNNDAAHMSAAFDPLLKGILGDDVKQSNVEALRTREQPAH